MKSTTQHKTFREIFPLHVTTSTAMSVPMTDPNAPGAVPTALPSYGVYSPPPAYGPGAAAPGQQGPYNYSPAHYDQYKAAKGTSPNCSRF